MKKLVKTFGIAREALIAFLMVIAAVSSYGRTVSVSSIERIWVGVDGLISSLR